MPPIMGSAAFLMATFLEVPYVVIMQMAFIPALLYYVGAGVGVFFMIRAAGLDPPRMAVDNKLILRTLPVFVVPMAVVVWLLFLYYSPGFAAFCGILLLVGIAVLQKETRPNRSQWIEAFTEAAKIGAQLSLILALVGILAQVALTTNLATKISSTIIGVVGVELVPILLISAFTAIVLGMGLPTPVAYVIMFVTVVPLMIDAGVEQFAANFFAFYFAILSTLTPPVALSVLAAAQLAGCSFMQAAAHSLRLSIVGYLLPFTMVFTPAILGFPDKVGLDGLLAIGVLVLASIAGGAALYGYFLRPLGPLDRIVQGAAALAGLFYVFSPNRARAGGARRTAGVDGPAGILLSCGDVALRRDAGLSDPMDELLPPVAIVPDVDPRTVPIIESCHERDAQGHAGGRGLGLHRRALCRTAAGPDGRRRHSYRSRGRRAGLPPLAGDQGRAQPLLGRPQQGQALDHAQRARGRRPRDRAGADDATGRERGLRHHQPAGAGLARLRGAQGAARRPDYDQRRRQPGRQRRG
jgi:TRAP-type C4-dicarboxylate transport system permease large subunit